MILKKHLTSEEVIPKMEEGKQVYMKMPEGSTIELEDIEQARRYLCSYLQFCDFYFEEV